MCGPTAAFIMAGASTAMSAYSSYQQGQQAKAAGNYQAAVMRNNEILAQRASADALARGNLAATKNDAAGNQLRGKQIATLAANGVVVGQDSALDINADTAASNKLDTLMIRRNAQLESNNYLAQGMNFDANAALAQAKGDNAATAGEFGAGTSLLAGAATVANKWYQYNPSTNYDFSNTNNSTINWN